MPTLVDESGVRTSPSCAENSQQPALEKAAGKARVEWLPQSSPNESITPHNSCFPSAAVYCANHN